MRKMKRQRLEKYKTAATQTMGNRATFAQANGCHKKERMHTVNGATQQ